MENNFFRNEVTTAVTSPEELDQAIRIIDRKTQMLVLGIVIFMGTCLLWGFYGSIPITLRGNGIIMPAGGVHYVIARQEGVIRSILVEQGEYVQAGDVVGSLEVDAADGSSKQVEIKSEINGRVAEIRSMVGDFAGSDEKIISLVSGTKDQTDLAAIMFVSLEHGKNLKPGMEVHIQPSNINKEEYGYVKGIVQQVADYPVSQKRLAELLGSEELVTSFSEGKVLLEVEVSLIPNETTVSGYQWSTPNGPPFCIYEGTLCTGDFIVNQIKPIELVMDGK